MTASNAPKSISKDKSHGIVRAGDPPIVGQFPGAKNHKSLCIIISLDRQKHPSLEAINKSLEQQGLKVKKEVTRFEFDGESYAVLEVDRIAQSSEGELDEQRSGSFLLTARELQVAGLVAKGYSNKQVAKQLKLSEWTISTHLRRIFMKLGVDSRAAMVYRCASLL